MYWLNRSLRAVTIRYNHMHILGLAALLPCRDPSLVLNFLKTSEAKLL